MYSFADAVHGIVTSHTHFCTSILESMCALHTFWSTIACDQATHCFRVTIYTPFQVLISQHSLARLTYFTQASFDFFSRLFWLFELSHRYRFVTYPLFQRIYRFTYFLISHASESLLHLMHLVTFSPDTYSYIHSHTVLPKSPIYQVHSLIDSCVSQSCLHWSYFARSQYAGFLCWSFHARSQYASFLWSLCLRAIINLDFQQVCASRVFLSVSLHVFLVASTSAGIGRMSDISLVHSLASVCIFAWN